jgi:gluconokinase
MGRRNGSQTSPFAPTDIARMRSLDPRAILIVIGVSGSGKTTIATALAQRLGWPLQEGDELHPPAFAKIHSAHPLDDRDQWSWLEKVAAWIDGCRQVGTDGVITCTALRRSYRDFLTRGRPGVRVVTPRTMKLPAVLC